MKAAREAWFEGQTDLDPERLIFIDESGLSTKMARLRGWAPEGERCHAAIPHGCQADPVRSQTVDRSNAAKLANICMTIRPLAIAGFRRPFSIFSPVLLHSRPLI